MVVLLPLVFVAVFAGIFTLGQYWIDRAKS